MNLKSITQEKNLLVVAAPFALTTAVYELAKSLQIHVYIMGNQNCQFCKRLVKLDLCKKHLQADIYSSQDKAIVHALEAIEDSGITFDGVFSFYEQSTSLVAQIGEALGLACNSLETINTIRNKAKCRKVCEQAGIAAPKYYAIQSKNDLEVAIKHVGYPAVLKPAFGSGSVGVVLVESDTQVYQAWSTICTAVQNDKFIRWNPGKDTQIIAILETFLDGPEFDVDGICENGEVVFASCSDNWEPFKPSFLESGSNCPSIYSKGIQDRLVGYTKQVLQAVEFQLGVFHCELKYTSEHGPMLIELNPRQGGGCVQQFNHEVWNVDLRQSSLLLSLQIPLCLDIAPAPLTYSSEYTLLSSMSGILQSTSFLDKIRSLPNVKEATVWSSVGDYIHGQDSSTPAWIGTIRVVASSLEESNKYLMKLVNSIQYPIKTSEQIA